MHQAEQIQRLEAISTTDLVLAKKSAQKQILDVFSMKKSFPPFRLKSPQFCHPSVEDAYLAWMLIDYQISPPIAKKMISIFDYVNEINCQTSTKLKQIDAIKQDLLKSGSLRLFNADSLPIDRIILVDSLPLDAKMEAFHPASFYLMPEKNTPVDILECLHKEMELDFAFQYIVSLIEKGVDLAKIHVLNLLGTDQFQLVKRLESAGIIVNTDAKIMLDKYPFTIAFLRVLKQDGYQNAMQYASEFVFEASSLEARIVEQILDIEAKYSRPILEAYPDILRYCLSTTYLEPISYVQAIQMESLDDFDLEEDGYYLVMNASSAFLPFCAKDDDYITDEEKAAIGMDTSFQTARRKRSLLEALFKRIANLRLSYSLSVDGIKQKPAQLLLFRPENKIDATLLNHTIYACASYGLLQYAKMVYDQNTYGIYRDEYEAFSKQYNALLTQYNSSFRPLSDQTKEMLRKRRVYLSAKSLKLYRECPFHFLLEQILKLTPKEESLTIFFGNLTHRMLETLYQTDEPNIEQIIEQSRPDFPKAIPWKSEVFLRVYQSRIRPLLDTLSRFKRETHFHEFAHEWNSQYELEQSGRFIVMGKIDRILTYETQAIQKAIVIDYKTGSQTFSMENFEKGIDIQLPFYLHLLNHDLASAGYQPMGFFYQKVHIGKYQKTDTEDPLQKSLLLDGLIVIDNHLKEHLVQNGWVKSVKLKLNREVGASSKIVSEATMKAINEKMEAMISDVASRIEAGSFDIRPFPKEVNESISKSCQYCPYISLCYLSKTNPLSDEGEEVTINVED